VFSSFFRLEEITDRSGGFPQFFNASRFEALDMSLELSQGDFDRVEVRRSQPNPVKKVMLFQWP
ncbi:MAG: hypothetical protein QGF71_01970, partial [Rhodospirillales bacterium]|nr:hypothetical protein [Rhodospirillales bacterium]